LFITNLDIQLKKCITIYQLPIIFSELVLMGILYAAFKLLILGLALLLIAIGIMHNSLLQKAFGMHSQC